MEWEQKSNSEENDHLFIKGIEFVLTKILFLFFFFITQKHTHKKSIKEKYAYMSSHYVWWIYLLQVDKSEVEEWYCRFYGYLNHVICISQLKNGSELCTTYYSHTTYIIPVPCFLIFSYFFYLLFFTYSVACKIDFLFVLTYSFASSISSTHFSFLTKRKYQCNGPIR